VGASLRDEIGVPLAPVELSIYERTTELLRESLGQEHFERLRDDGRSMPVDAVLDEILGPAQVP
jgi:hypothetical protein